MAFGRIGSMGRGFGRSSAGGKGGAASAPLDGLSPTGAWSSYRKLLSAYGGTFYTLTSGKVSTWSDQTGNARNLTQASATIRPVISTSGVAGLLFDGANTQLKSAALMSSFISVSSGYIIASIRPTGFTSDNGGSLLYLNAPIFQDDNQNTGLLTRANAGSPLVYAESDPKYAQVGVTANVPYVVEWRHEAGTLFLRLNGATENSLLAGDSAAINAVVNVGQKSGAYQGYIFEIATFTAVPSQIVRDQLVQSFGAQVGAF